MSEIQDDRYERSDRIKWITQAQFDTCVTQFLIRLDVEIEGNLAAARTDEERESANFQRAYVKELMKRHGKNAFWRGG